MTQSGLVGGAAQFGWAAVLDTNPRVDTPPRWWNAGESEGFQREAAAHGLKSTAAFAPANVV